MTEQTTYTERFVEGTDLQMLTRDLQKNNTSGHRGVVWHKRDQRWLARIKFQKKNYHLGSYIRKEDAIAARKEAEERLYHPILEEYLTIPSLTLYYFTFGSGHRLAGHCLPIYASNEALARTKMHELHGNKWAFCYPEERWLHYKDNPLRAWKMETELPAVYADGPTQTERRP